MIKQKIETLLSDLRKLKSEHNLFQVSVSKKEIPLIEFYEICEKHKAEFWKEGSCLTSLIHLSGENIFIQIYSEEKQLPPIRVEDEPNFCGYDEIAHNN